jgi:hypothetical protein
VLSLTLKSDLQLVRPVPQEATENAPVAAGASVAEYHALEHAQVSISGLTDSREAALGKDLATDVPNASNWRVTGEVVPGSIDTGTDMALRWQLVGDGGEAPCGVLSVNSANPDIASATLRSVFLRAIRNSAVNNKATCA